jgi:hypothetical protein
VTVACPPLTIGLLPHLIITYFLIGLANFHLVQLISQQKLLFTAYSLPWWWRQFAPLKCQSTSMRLHGVVSQEAVIFIFTTMRTWNLTSLFLFCL